MFPLFATIMLMLSAIYLLVSVGLIVMASKKLKIFMKVMKSITILNIAIAILDILAIVLYFL
jgi:hypothetical protein